MADKNQIEETILWALKMEGISGSMSLDNLIGWIDLRLRILISLPEINNALQTLISKGYLQETLPLYYSLSSSENPKNKIFRSISESEYEDAIETYKRKLEQATAEYEAEERRYGVSRRLISIIWTIGKREFDDDIENVLNKLAEEIEPILDIKRENVKTIKPESLLLDGIEIGSSPKGNEVIIWIQGYDEDDPIDIYNEIVPLFRKFKPPFGNLKVIIHPLGKENIIHYYD